MNEKTTENERLTKELEKAKIQLETEKGACERLTKELKATSESIKEMQNEAEQNTKSLNDVTAKLEESQNDSEKLSAENVRLEKENRELKSQIEGQKKTDSDSEHEEGTAAVGS